MGEFKQDMLEYRGFVHNFPSQKVLSHSFYDFHSHFSMGSTIRTHPQNSQSHNFNLRLLVKGTSKHF